MPRAKIVSRSLIDTSGYNSRIKEIFPKRYILLKEKYKISNMDMERMSGHDHKALLKLEKGEAVPGAAILAKLSDLFCVSVDWLLGLSDDDRFDELYGARTQAFLDDPNAPVAFKIDFLRDEKVSPEYKVINFCAAKRMAEELSDEERARLLDSKIQESLKKALAALLEVRENG